MWGTATHHKIASVSKNFFMTCSLAMGIWEEAKKSLSNTDLRISRRTCTNRFLVLIDGAWAFPTKAATTTRLRFLVSVTRDSRFGELTIERWISGL